MPLPDLVRPLVPATIEDKVAVFPLDTEIVGAPEGAARVSVSPVTVKSASLKTNPPMVIGPASVAVPAVPVKNAISVAPKVPAAAAVSPTSDTDQLELLSSDQEPVPPTPATEVLVSQ